MSLMKEKLAIRKTDKYCDYEKKLIKKFRKFKALSDVQYRHTCTSVENLNYYQYTLYTGGIVVLEDLNYNPQCLRRPQSNHNRNRDVSFVYTDLN